MDDKDNIMYLKNYDEKRFILASNILYTVNYGKKYLTDITSRLLPNSRVVRNLHARNLGYNIAHSCIDDFYYRREKHVPDRMYDEIFKYIVDCTIKKDTKNISSEYQKIYEYMMDKYVTVDSIVLGIIAMQKYYKFKGGDNAKPTNSIKYFEVLSDSIVSYDDEFMVLNKIGGFIINNADADEISKSDIIRISIDNGSNIFGIKDLYIEFGKFVEVSRYIVDEKAGKITTIYDQVLSDPPFLKTNSENLQKIIY